MDCWEVTGTWVNTKPTVVSPAKKKVVKEDSPRPQKKARTAYSDEEDTDTASRIGAVGYLVKPLSERSLLTTIQVGLASGKRDQQLTKKVEDLDTKLAERKVIERAKGILMEENNLSEDAAYKMLRNLSMSKRQSMNAIAELIVMDA